MCDLYHVNLTSKQVKIIMFQLATHEYHNLDTDTMKLARIQPYLYGQWPLDLCWLEGVNPPQKVRPISGFDK